MFLKKIIKKETARVFCDFHIDRPWRMEYIESNGIGLRKEREGNKKRTNICAKIWYFLTEMPFYETGRFEMQN